MTKSIIKSETSFEFKVGDIVISPTGSIVMVTYIHVNKINFSGTYIYGKELGHHNIDFLVDRFIPFKGEIILSSM